MYVFYDIGELYSNYLHITEYTVQLSSLLIKLLQTTDFIHQNQLPGNPRVFPPTSSLLLSNITSNTPTSRANLTVAIAPRYENAIN